MLLENMSLFYDRGFLIFGHDWRYYAAGWVDDGYYRKKGNWKKGW
jgi:hypothetical protein